MRRILIVIACFLGILVISSCKKDKKGCTDPKALNRNADADVSDGSCTYSTAIFYMSVINPARPVSISVGGNSVGIITAQYPNGPGNCSAPGCAIFQFKSGQKLDWVATEPGGLIWTGTIEPNSSLDCMKIRVY